MFGISSSSTTLAFSDTAPIIIHSNNQDALESNHKYITKFVDVKSKVDEIIKESCSNKNSKLFIYQIEDLSIESDYSWLLNKGSYPNVLYHEKMKPTTILMVNVKKRNLVRFNLVF